MKNEITTPLPPALASTPLPCWPAAPVATGCRWELTPALDSSSGEWWMAVCVEGGVFPLCYHPEKGWTFIGGNPGRPYPILNSTPSTPLSTLLELMKNNSLELGGGWVNY